MNVLFIMKKWYTIRAIIPDGRFFMKHELIDNILNPNFNFDENDYEDTSTAVETTCLNRGYTEHVPDFIYGECSKKKYNLKLKKVYQFFTAANVIRKQLFLLNF